MRDLKKVRADSCNYRRDVKRKATFSKSPSLLSDDTAVGPRWVRRIRNLRKNSGVFTGGGVE